jgi:hypothetical protein
VNDGWNTARRELIVAALLVLALTATAWAFDGPAMAGVVLVICVVVSLVTLRGLIDPDEEPALPEPGYQDGPTQSFRGFWRTQADLGDASRSLSAWDYLARPRLTNLLAARLSERHGVSLSDDPETARRLLLRRPSRLDLWYWIDPQRPTPPDASSRPGIPPRALAALIDRLEQL